ncbi:hypothetical protein DICVIV_08392 [Dictyocaulus viviparus]|uniref:ATP-dependent Clp protease proteolytic subunit n=1 Tax=Dictyocaulus viviparus TaxID=29172 RepID=A0A0D8XLY7_DICVI|nr:hypothetical protein DICVIV_08392 [Dictyocaulus viviparus]
MHNFILRFRGAYKSILFSIYCCLGLFLFFCFLLQSWFMVRSQRKVIQETLDRDRFMSAHEAKRFGIVDKVESHKGCVPSE